MANIGQMLRAWWSIVSSTYHVDIPPSIIAGLEYGTLAIIGYAAGSYLAEATARAKLKHNHAELPEESKAGIRFVFGGISAILTSAGYYFGPYASIGGFITGATILPYLFIHAPGGKKQKAHETTPTKTSTATMPTQRKEITLDDLAKEIETPVAPKKAVAQATKATPAPMKKPEARTAPSPAKTATTATQKKEHKSIGAIIGDIFHKKTEPKKQEEAKKEKKQEIEKAAKPTEEKKERKQAEEEGKQTKKKIAADVQKTEKKLGEKAETGKPEKKIEEAPKQEKPAAKGNKEKKGLLASIFGSLHRSQKKESDQKHAVEKPKIIVEEVGTEHKRVESMDKKKLRISLPKHVKVEEIKAEHVAPAKGKQEVKTHTPENQEKKTAVATAKPIEKKENAEKKEEDPEILEFRSTLRDMEKKYILHEEVQKKPIKAEQAKAEKLQKQQPIVKKSPEELIKEKPAQAPAPGTVKTPAQATKKIRPRDVNRAVKKILNELKKHVKDEILANDGKKIHTWREVRAANEAAEKIAKTAEPIIRQRIMETGSTNIDPKAMAAQILAEIQGKTAPEVAEPTSSAPANNVVRHEDITKIAEEVFEQVKDTIPVEESAPKEEKPRHHGHEKRQSKEEEKKEKKEKKQKKKKSDDDLLGLLGEEGEDSGDISDLLGGESGGGDDLNLDLGDEEGEDEDLGDLGELLK